MIQPGLFLRILGTCPSEASRLHCREGGIERWPARWGVVDTKKRSQSGWCLGHVLTQLTLRRAGYPGGVCAPEDSHCLGMTLSITGSPKADSRGMPLVQGVLWQLLWFWNYTSSSISIQSSLENLKSSIPAAQHLSGGMRCSASINYILCNYRAFLCWSR